MSFERTQVLTTPLFRFESGGRMGHTIVYQLDTFPLSMIGPVEVIWQPWAICDGRPVSDDRKIWLRVHPSIFTESWTVLKFAISSLGDSDHAGPSEVSKHGICMRDLRQELEAFEITGPKAGKALKRIFKLCKLQNDSTISVRTRRMPGSLLNSSSSTKLSLRSMIPLRYRWT